MSESTEFTGEADLSVMSKQDILPAPEKKKKTYSVTIHSVNEYNDNKKVIFPFFIDSVKSELKTKPGSAKTLCTKFFEGQVPEYETMGYLFEYIIKNFKSEAFYVVKEKNEKGETVTKKVSKKKMKILKLRTWIWQRLTSSEFVLRALAEIVDVDYEEWFAYLQYAAKLIFENLEESDFYLKLGVKYLLFCKSNYDLSLEASMFEFWQDLRSQKMYDFADYIHWIFRSQELFVEYADA